jgi:hypothetical protein
VPGGYVEDLAGDALEKGGNLRHDDLLALARGGVLIHCHGVAAWRAQALRMADDVRTGLCGAHLIAAGPASVNEGLTIVIVYLFDKFMKATSVSATVERSCTR